jgi:amidase
MDPTLPAHRLAELTRARTIGCLELLDLTLDRVQRLNPRLNAVILQDADRARSRARALDSQADRSAPLFGVPMTVKESFDYAGHPTTWGFSHLRGHRAARDAVALRRLEAGGAVIFGKTNVPVALADWQSHNPIYGVTRNPWNLAYTPGGSSGGAAAACAAGFNGLELGSDIGGSIRVPAHFCGLFGHKPSWNLATLRGHSFLPDPGAPTDISCIGPLARSARDLHIALNLIAGPDPDDHAATITLPPPRATSLAGLRVAVWAEQPGQATSQETTALITELAGFLAKSGAQVDTSARPDFDVTKAYHLFLQLLDSALSGRLPPQVLEQRLAAKAALSDDDESANAVMLRATGITHGAWLTLHDRRTRIRLAWSAFFRDWDVLLCPVVATPAFPLDPDSDMAGRTLQVDGHTIPYADQLFWPGIIGGFHLPATVAPLGLSQSGLPIGVQIAGPIYGDLQTLAVATLLEQSWRGFEPPPAWG